MEKGASDKFFLWAFTVGRGILMTVYAVALIAFVYRIFLDREILDLKDTISQSQVRISLAEDNEKKFRDVHERLSFVNESSILSKDEIMLLDTIIQTATGRVIFNTVAISETQVTMEGSVNSINTLNGFINEIRALPEIKSVVLDRLESRVDQGTVAFSLTAIL